MDACHYIIKLLDHYLKPTVGLVSRAGIIPIAHSQDTAGPMARTVADAALLLGVLAGVDPRDQATGGNAAKALSDYTNCLDPDGVRGVRLGVVRNFCGFHERVDQLFEECLTALREGGAEIVDPAALENTDPFGPAERQVLLYEFKDGLNRYLETLGPEVPVRTLEEIIDFNERHREKVMPYFGQETFLKAQEKGPLREKAYLEAREKSRRLAGPEGIDATLEKRGVDALVVPSG